MFLTGFAVGWIIGTFFGFAIACCLAKSGAHMEDDERVLLFFQRNCEDK